VNVVLATELIHKSLWYPTILGGLVVIAAFSLFVGSVYLLLGTNLGARLGFLITVTAFAGFMVILSMLWMTTASPLNTVKGRIPNWHVKEVVSDLGKSSYPAARTIESKGHKIPTAQQANLKAAVDEKLVTKVATPTAPLEPNANEFAQFPDVTKYAVANSYEVGGSKPKFYKLQFSHKQRLAVVEYCAVEPTPADRPFGLPPLPARCSTAANAKTGFVVLVFDYGTLRMPPVIAFLCSLILFALGLLGLHWREKDEMAARANAATGPVPVPAR
jgi:hypothetical protein